MFDLFQILYNYLNNFFWGSFQSCWKKMQNNIKRNEKSVEGADSQAIQPNEDIEVIGTKSRKVMEIELS